LASATEPLLQTNQRYFSQQYFAPEHAVKYPELDFIHELPRQYEEIGRGGQAAVFMLTDPALSQPETPKELYVAPRVIKIALGDAAIRGYVRDSIGITDPIEQDQKVRELMFHQYVTFDHVLKVAIHVPSLYEAFGRPRPTLPLSPFHHTPDDQHSIGTTYTQDYLQPIARLLPKLDPSRTAHRRLGRSIVSQYINLQLNLIPHGLFDTSYKLTDNYAVDEEGRLRITDFSELRRNRNVTKASIADREWEQIGDRREHTLLPDWLTPYFNTQLQNRITIAQLDSWDTARPAAIDPRTQATFFDYEASRLWLNHLHTLDTQQEQ
jgi:hypothetical protein